MYKFLLSLLALIYLQACGKHSEQAPVTVPVLSVNELVEVAGVVRFDESSKQWLFINDANHEPIGVLRVDTFNDYMEIIFSEPTSKVVTFVITPDETYALRGIFIGASVGTDLARIYFSQVQGGLIVRLTSPEMAIPGGNFWFYGKFKK